MQWMECPVRNGNSSWCPYQEKNATNSTIKLPSHRMSGVHKGMQGIFTQWSSLYDRLSKIAARQRYYDDTVLLTYTQQYKLQLFGHVLCKPREKGLATVPYDTWRYCHGGQVKNRLARVKKNVDHLGLQYACDFRRCNQGCISICEDLETQSTAHRTAIRCSWS